MSLSLRVLTLAVLVVVTGVASALAQSLDGQSAGGLGRQAEQARRPYRGLFGSGPENPDRTESLVLNASIFGGYDNNLTAGTTGVAPIDPRFQGSGYRVGMSANLSYSKQWERASFGAIGGSAFSYYPDVQEPFVAQDTTLGSYNGGVGFSAPLGERTTLRASQTAGYSPAYTLGVFPALPGGVGDVTLTPPGFDRAIYTQEGYRFDTTAMVTRNLSSRSTMEVFYERHTSDYKRQSFDLREQRVGGRVTHQLSKGLALRLGYAYREGDYAFVETSEPVRSHEIDAGVNYNRAFSFSRRTTLTFATGSAIVVIGDPGQSSGVAYGSGTHYELLVNAALNHEIARTWNARVAYYRGVQYVEGFTQPLLSDSVTAGVGGLLSRRVSASVITEYSNGAVGYTIAGNGYDTYSGVAGLQVAISRSLAAFAQYIFQHYEFGSGVVLPPGFASLLDRHGPRVGLNVSVPLIQ